MATTLIRERAPHYQGKAQIGQPSISNGLLPLKGYSGE
jgi:hypothetical protein